jgi:hypothetical protein
MEKNYRDRLAQELVDDYNVNVVIAAACKLMLKQSGKDRDSFTREQIADFIDNLDTDGLMELQEIADDIEIYKDHSKK